MGLSSFLSLSVTTSSQMEEDSTPEPSSFVAMETAVTGDRIVSSEIEAAEALAGLAHRVARQVSEGDKWSRTDSLPSKLEGETSVLKLMTSEQDAATLTFEQHHLNEESSSKVRTTNDGKVVKLPKSNVGKSRLNLNEEEKEARRLRRVLANRESARETIRRRQAHLEELMKKATRLAWENGDLQKEKELVIEEYDNLKKINESLKAQIFNVEETNVKPKTIPPEAFTSRPACHPPFRYNQPAFFWSPLIHGSQNVSSEQENDDLANSPGIPLCVYPCAWFMPRTDHNNPFHLWPFNDPSAFTKTVENHEHLYPQFTRLESVTEEVDPVPSQSDKASDCSTSNKKQTDSSALVNGKKRSKTTAVAAEARRRGRN